MESRNPFKEEVRSLQEENKNLSEELNHLKYKIIYYENKDFEKKVATCSREEINELMHEIHNDTEFLMDSYAPPKLIRYYHELLSRLIKNYGH
jgi:uncharacterized protein YydD (DUF2326 family)